MQKITKKVKTRSLENCTTDGRTNGHADKSNLVEPFMRQEVGPVRSPTKETSLKMFFQNILLKYSCHEIC